MSNRPGKINDLQVPRGTIWNSKSTHYNPPIDPNTDIIQTWYHSHLCLQAAEVLTGGIIINGPSTANYDEDLGTMLLMDWSHTSAFNAWKSSRIYGLEIATQNGLINGSNTFNCDETTDAACIRGGKRCETSFVGGKKYRIRLVGSQADGYIKFTIDQRELALGFTYEVLNGFKLHWTVNTKNLEIDWAQPTLQIIDDGGSVFPTDSNIVDVAVQNQVRPAFTPSIPSFVFH